MSELIGHRGPDSTGEIHEVVHDKNIFFGHKRLSVLDLSVSGSQPMTSSSNNTTICYNGEVYNFENLKNVYLKDQPFKSSTDTEVILYLYEKFGIEFVNYLNGDFAIAILDRKKKKVFLVKDRVGVKPLYFYYNTQTFLFASEIKSMLAIGCPSELNEDQLENYFVFKYVPGNNTLFKNIYRVPPAHYMELDLKSFSLKVEKYWELKKIPEFQKISYHDAKDALYNLIKKSIELRLISDVPIGNFLSGGLDSSIIASFLRNQNHIKHFCASKQATDLAKEGTSNDFFYASQLARKWNIPLEQVPIGKEQLSAELIRSTIYYGDDLIADGSQIPSYLISKEASLHCKVMLSGMGADEIFLGYGGHIISMMALYLDKFPKLFSGPMVKFMGNLKVGQGKFKAYKRYLKKLGKYYNEGSQRYGYYSIVGDFANALSIFKPESHSATDFISPYFEENEDPFDALFKMEMENFLVKNLHYTDRMTMAHSMECRVPFLDHNIIEFAYNLPRNYKISHLGRTKRILKDTFNTHLPSFIQKRRKAGFGMPLRSLFSDKNQINALLDYDFFAEMNGFCIDSIKSMIEMHLYGLEDNSSLIYALISFQNWHEMFIQGVGNLKTITKPLPKVSYG